MIEKFLEVSLSVGKLLTKPKPFTVKNSCYSQHIMNYWLLSVVKIVTACPCG